MQGRALAHSMSLITQENTRYTGGLKWVIQNRLSEKYTVDCGCSSPQSTENSLTHTKEICKYRIVFAQKY